MLSFRKKNAVETPVDHGMWYEAWHGTRLCFLSEIVREDLKDPGFCRPEDRGIWCFAPHLKHKIDTYRPAIFIARGIFAKCHLHIFARGMKEGHPPKTVRVDQWRTTEARAQNIFLEIFHAHALTNDETVVHWESLRRS